MNPVGTRAKKYLIVDADNFGLGPGVNRTLLIRQHGSANRGT